MKTKVLYNTQFLQLKQAVSPEAKPWFYFHRPNTTNIVAIVAIIEKKYIIFLETNRPPIYCENIAKTCIELPAGLVGDEIKNETIHQAIEKELLEETGYKADKITVLADKISSSAGCTSEVITLCRVEVFEDKISQTPITDGGIIKEIHKIPLNKVKEWLIKQEKVGKSISSQLFAGLYLAL